MTELAHVQPKRVTDRASVDTAIGVLTQRFGDRVACGEAIRSQHANTMSWVPPQPPDAVVFVESGTEVQEVVRVCATHRVPIIPFGTGTSFEGHVNAPFGGISVDTSRMNRIISVNPEDLDCVVEPGVTRKALNDYVKSHGLFFPIDPGADASLGGMTATRASGTNAVRYGTMRENVLALKAVTADGEVLTAGRRVKKSSSGYDLARLFVGSEGTLGLITEITLKLHGIPEAISAGVCPFPSVKEACDATIATIQMGIPVARIELVDEVQIRACNLYSKLDLPETPHLFLEFHGTEASVKEQAERFGEIAAEFGAGAFTWAIRPEDRTRLWQARHDAYWATFKLRPGAAAVPTDVCLPLSRLAEFVAETKRDLDESRLVAPMVGHVGDGNFHVQILVDPANAEEVARTAAFVNRLNLRAIAMDGTCTGEHGVGQGKAKYLEAEHGAAALAAMRAIKKAFDPLNLMNPGKMSLD
jgi:D-lactate dehydrogenase (cytochrome)